MVDTTIAAEALPRWADDLQTKYGASISHAFILHFNVRDYVAVGKDVHRFLDEWLLKTDIIVHYNRAEGITFAQPSMKQEFLAGVAPAAPQATNPAARFLQAASPAAQANPQGDPELSPDPASALPKLEALLRQGPVAQNGDGKVHYGRRAVVVIDWAETICPSAEKAMMGPADRTNLVTIARWGIDPEIAATGNIVILIVNNLSELHPDLRAASAKFEAIEVGLPNHEERLAFVEQMALAHPEVELDEPAERLAAATAGLSRLHIEDIWLRASAGSGVVTRALVRERKNGIIASEYAEVIEIVEPEVGFEVIGGLPHVKNFLAKSVIKPMAAGNTRRVPMGILFLGPAGTGKTVMATALAKEAGVNFVLLRVEKLLGGIVGTSEKNLEKALRCIDSLAPTIVFVDELDQKVRRGEGGASDGGSSVNNNLFSRLLQYMSDTSHRGRVVFIGASNRPDLIDAAMKRPGRFDKKLPFLCPEAPEREAIVRALFRKYAINWAGDASLSDVAAATEGWTGAELESLVLKGLEIAEDDERDEVLVSDLLNARGRLKAATKDIDEMTALALLECDDMDLVPERYQARWQDNPGLQTQAEALAERSATVGRGGKRSI